MPITMQEMQVQLETAHEMIRQLQAAMGIHHPWKVDTGITGTERDILGCIMAAPTVCRKDALMTALYSHRTDDSPSENVLSVFICKLRRKLLAYDLAIITVWGIGWAMTDEQKARARQLFWAT